MADRSAEPTRRPRMTMLVDGGVVGDSRVQKAALTAAEAGYDVTLVGRAPSGVADEFTIGPVRVLRVAAPYTLLSAERRRPRGRWRFPLAYRSADDVTLRKRLLDVRWTDYQAQVQLTKHRLAATPSKAEQALLRGRLIARRGRWVADSYLHRARSLQFRRAVDYVKEPHGPVETAALALARTALREGAWRRLDPVLWDLEIAFGPVIDGLTPDVIHAHDFRMSGVAVRAAARARAKGRRLPVVYDVHEYVPGVHARSARWRAANTAYEREYIRHVDAVVTVSPTLADLLQRDYGLAERPTVVLNAPPLHPVLAGRELPDIRRRCGLGAEPPLLVYSGSGSATRGLATMVEALPELPGVHVAIVVGARIGAVVDIEDRAAALGVRDRFHVLRYVPPELVPTFLASATAGVIPILHYPNHEIALITKYFEYVHARLPIIVSDVKTMAERTRELGNGVVFTAGDVGDFVRAVRELLADRDRFAKVYADAPELLEEYSWERQAATLRALWQRVTGLTPEPRPASAAAADTAPAPVLQLRVDEQDTDLAGTARAWAAALGELDQEAAVDLAGAGDEPGAATHVALLGRRWLATDPGRLAELLLAREQRGERLLLVVPADPAYDVPALRCHLVWLGLSVLTTDPAVAAAVPAATLVPEPADAATAEAGARVLLDFLRG